MKIYVKVAGGNGKPIDIGSARTIKDVKVKIQGVCGIQPCEQQLIFCNRVLNDERTLDYYQIEKESVVHVVARLRSGTGIASEKREAREIVLPDRAINLEILEDYLRTHVDAGARVEQSSDPDVVGIVIVNTDDILTADQLREVIRTSEQVSAEELEAWVEEYGNQQRERSAQETGSDPDERQQYTPWITLLSCGHPKPERTGSIDLSACDLDPAEYSDGGLQDYWIRNKTAVDCEVRTSRESPGYATIARIDSMSGGCFISRRLLNILQATPDEETSCSFQCPNGILETKGTVKLLVYWKDTQQKVHCAKVKFYVPGEWYLAVDMLVTVPMAEALGIDKVARGVTRDNILAANERIFGRIFFRSQDKKAKAEAEKANAIKAQQNLKDEAQWMQKHEVLRHSSQPCPGSRNQIPV